METIIKIDETIIQKLKHKSNTTGININELANNYLHDALDNELEYKETFIKKMEQINKEKSIPLENIDDLFK